MWETSVASLLNGINQIDINEQTCNLSGEDHLLRHDLQDKYRTKCIQDEVKWRLQSRDRWIKEGDKNTIFFTP